MMSYQHFSAMGSDPIERRGLLEVVKGLGLVVLCVNFDVNMLCKFTELM